MRNVASRQEPRITKSFTCNPGMSVLIHFGQSKQWHVEVTHVTEGTCGITAVSNNLRVKELKPETEGMLAKWRVTLPKKGTVLLKFLKNSRYVVRATSAESMPVYMRKAAKG